MDHSCTWCAGQISFTQKRKAKMGLFMNDIAVNIHEWCYANAKKYNHSIGLLIG